MNLSLGTEVLFEDGEQAVALPLRRAREEVLELRAEALDVRRELLLGRHLRGRVYFSYRCTGILNTGIHTGT